MSVMTVDDSTAKAAPAEATFLRMENVSRHYGT
jgi:hypothetical protein